MVANTGWVIQDRKEMKLTGRALELLALEVHLIIQGAEA